MPDYSYIGWGIIAGFAAAPLIYFIALWIQNRKRKRNAAADKNS